MSNWLISMTLYKEFTQWFYSITPVFILQIWHRNVSCSWDLLHVAYSEDLCPLSLVLLQATLFDWPAVPVISRCRKKILQRILQIKNLMWVFCITSANFPLTVSKSPARYPACSQISCWKERAFKLWMRLRRMWRSSWWWDQKRNWPIFLEKTKQMWKWCWYKCVKPQVKYFERDLRSRYTVYVTLFFYVKAGSFSNRPHIYCRVIAGLFPSSFHTSLFRRLVLIVWRVAVNNAKHINSTMSLSSSTRHLSHLDSDTDTSWHDAITSEIHSSKICHRLFYFFFK